MNDQNRQRIASDQVLRSDNGVLVLLALEISFTSSPFGLLLFVIKGAAAPNVTMRRIIVAALPFIGLEIPVLEILVAIPDLSTWLPKPIVTRR